GIGPAISSRILSAVGVDQNVRAGQLTDVEVAKIRSFIDENVKVEGDLRKDIAMNIKRFMDLGTYRGLRHRRGLPVRGQRTHTNARTRKGPKRAAVKGKRKV
ncbi:MAG: 30S ribosomal protein S13, partial [Deltaproteobacteria bacterium]|nr:30S ribosomal protein S13 [Deltaproteobacteria bacterium]